MSKKIIILGPAHPLRGGGITTFNEILANHIQENGHQVTIWSYKVQYPNFLFPGKSQFTDDTAPKGIHIKTMINSVNPFNWIRVGMALQKEKPDVIIVRYWMSFFGPCLGTILRLVMNKKVDIVGLVDNVYPHETKFYDKLFNTYFFNSCNRFVCLSEKVAKDLNDFTSKKIIITPHPLYDNYGEVISKKLACEKLKIKQDDKINLLFFGFIRQYKGLDILIKALSLQKRQNYRLIIAGEFYEKEKEITEALKSLSNDNVSLFTDFIPNDKVYLYFSASDWVVLPYRSATQSGISQTALHFNKPMIATNVGGLSEFVVPNISGILCEPTPEGLSRAISRVLEPTQLNYQESIEVYKKQFSWYHFIHHFIQD